MDEPITTDNQLNSLAILNVLKSQITFHNKWKNITMWSYSVSSTGIIVCSASAMLFAALNHGTTAAVFAAVSTVLASAEKSLLMREKWKIHLSIQIALQNLDLDIAAGLVDSKTALHELKRIGQSYSKDLPVESRVG